MLGQRRRQRGGGVRRGGSGRGRARERARATRGGGAALAHAANRAAARAGGRARGSRLGRGPRECPGGGLGRGDAGAVARTEAELVAVLEGRLRVLRHGFVVRVLTRVVRDDERAASLGADASRRGRRARARSKTRMRAFGAAAAAFHAKPPDRGRAGARRERHRLVTTRKARADESARGASVKRVRDGRARGVGVGPARVDPSRLERYPFFSAELA